MAEHSIWLDALEVAHTGGWKLDTQYVHLMGCPYLLAAGEPGIPVEDARTTVHIPQKDTYRIWVRDRNWLRPHAPGAFTLSINGTPCGVRLGCQPSDAWVWEIAGDFVLEGEVELAVQDLTGYFARFSSIVITNDFDYVPAREIERMYIERAKIKGAPRGIAEGGTYDVIVAGGGPGGVPAAIASARMGMKTLLLQNRAMLGGNGSSELGITFEGAGSKGVRETGIAEELRRLRDSDPERPGDWTRALEKMVAAEPNLTVIYHQHVCAVEMESEGVIRAAIALNILKLSKTRYVGKMFIDCTGDAWLGYYAGAKYRYGREAAHQHGEGLAPEIADTQTMSGCIRGDKRVFFTKTDAPVPYTAPDWVPKLPDNDEEFGRKIHAVSRLAWWVEAPNTYDDMWDGEQTRDALFLVLLGYYDFLKNHWSERQKAQNVRFNFASIMDGRRESRRLIGDYILTEDDCVSGRQFEDAISYTGWALDIHHPEGIYSGKKGPLYCSRHVKNPEVPFRCLYSKNIENLLFAGRNISTTHIAMGTTRVQNTIVTFGQTVGTAAAMCVRLGETPRGIYLRHMKQLQQELIGQDLYIPRVKSCDPSDPCLGADVTSSGFCTTEIYRTAKGSLGPFLPLDVDRAVDMSYSETLGDLEAIYVCLRSERTEPTHLTLTAQPAGGDADTYAKAGEIYQATLTVPPMWEGWVKCAMHIPTARNRFVESVRVRVMLPATEGIFWRSIENGTMYQKAGVRDENGNWVMTAYTSMCASATEPIERLANCRPENVVNGYPRFVSAEEYEWVSDPTALWPQWIVVSPRHPTVIDRVSIVFDTDLVNPGVAWGIKVAEPPKCVKDYTVEIFDGAAWHTVAEQKDNIFRKRAHRIPPMMAEKIRITVNATWGDPSARIMQITAHTASAE